MSGPVEAGEHGVPEAVWGFHIGGYQVRQKWLKDRKGRTLFDDDIAHHQKIVVALALAEPVVQRAAVNSGAIRRKGLDGAPF